MPGEISRRQRAALILTALASFVAKVTLALRTYGTNDVYTYQRFAVWSRYFGADLYDIAPDLNHPPSMLHVLRAILWVAEHTSLPFQFWIRFPGILADVGTLWLICRILGARFAEKRIFTTVLLIAIAPIHILISGFHGNTDPVMIFFVIAAVWLAGYRDQALAGGIAFGMGFCIKIAPVILCPVFFLWLRGARRRAVFFGAASAVVLLAWSPYAFEQPGAIYRQVFGYKSSYGLWGVSWLMREVAIRSPRFQGLNSAFSHVGTPLVLAVVVVVSVYLSRLSTRPSLYTQVGMIFLVFFAGTSGFAVQYLAWLTPWVAELGSFPVAWFVMTGSVFLLVVYNYWTLGMPWYLAIAYPWGSHQYFQALCWLSVLLLTVVAWQRVARGRNLSVPAVAALPAVLGAGVLLGYQARVHMKRDSLSVPPVYANDTVLFTRSDELQNLATELQRRGRSAEASSVSEEARRLGVQAESSYEQLIALHPERKNQSTPEEYLYASQSDYNQEAYAQCAWDAAQALKWRPGIPGAWYNIALCDGQIGDWDGALAAAREAVRLEPESSDARAGLEWALDGKRRASGLATDLHR